MSNKVLRGNKMSGESVLIEHAPLSASLEELEMIDLDGLSLEDSSQFSGDQAEAQPVPSPEEVARAEAELLLQTAQDKAAAVLADAEEKRAQVLLDAKDAGFAAGYAEGIEEGKEAAHRVITVTQDIAARLLREEKRMVRALEGRLSKLAVEIARKIIRDELKLGQHHVSGLVRIALRRFADEEKVVVRLNPVDLETLRRDHDDLTELMDNSETVKIVEDRRVSRGGCLVDTPTGCLDARAEVQLERVAELFEVEASYGVGSMSGEHSDPDDDESDEDDSDSDASDEELEAAGGETDA